MRKIVMAKKIKPISNKINKKWKKEKNSSGLRKLRCFSILSQTYGLGNLPGMVLGICQCVMFFSIPIK
jgi:hypothetical protein